LVGAPDGRQTGGWRSFSTTLFAVVIHLMIPVGCHQWSDLPWLIWVMSLGRVIVAGSFQWVSTHDLCVFSAPLHQQVPGPIFHPGGLNKLELCFWMAWTSLKCVEQCWMVLNSVEQCWIVWTVLNNVTQQLIQHGRFVRLIES
jgi:hypothetical protein